MSGWFDRVLDAVQSAAVIGERVERLGDSVSDLAAELRALDRRVARLEGALGSGGGGGSGSRRKPKLLPPPED